MNLSNWVRMFTPTTNVSTYFEFCFFFHIQINKTKVVNCWCKHFQDHRAMMEENKRVQEQVMDQFPFFEDQPSSSFLQLAAPVLSPYLQLGQPNVQEYFNARDPDQP